MNNRKGFTLIEFLIIVAIIRILATIAVPKFLNAQKCAKVTRAESDIRNIDQAIRMYVMDNKFYPVKHGLMHERSVPLTIPISYMSSIPLDPFNPNPLDNSSGPKDVLNVLGNYDYWTRYWAHQFLGGRSYWEQITAFPPNRYEWQLRGLGPTTKWIAELLYSPGHPRAGEYVSYEMSNGLYSEGNIVRYGP